MRFPNTVLINNILQFRIQILLLLIKLNPLSLKPLIYLNPDISNHLLNLKPTLHVQLLYIDIDLFLLHHAIFQQMRNYQNNHIPPIIS